MAWWWIYVCQWIGSPMVQVTISNLNKNKTISLKNKFCKMSASLAWHRADLLVPIKMDTALTLSSMFANQSIAPFSQSAQTQYWPGSVHRQWTGHTEQDRLVHGRPILSGRSWNRILLICEPTFLVMSQTDFPQHRTSMHRAGLDCKRKCCHFN